MPDAFVPDPAALSFMLTSEDGLVGQDIIRRVNACVPLARDRAPKKTGKLASRVYGTFVRDATGVTGIVGDSADYALDVHNGTRPHEIRPNKARVLAFQVGGTTVFATVVQHPGIRPQPFLLEALAATGIVT